MINNIENIQQMIAYIEKQLLDINKQLKQNDKNIEKILKSVKKNDRYSFNNEYSIDTDIKVVSYVDN